MKFNVCKIIRILFYCVLISEAIVCSATSVTVSATTESESESEGKFLMSAGFLKKKKPIPVIKKISKPIKIAPKLLKKPTKLKTENLNLIQKSEALKKSAKIDENNYITSTHLLPSDNKDFEYMNRKFQKLSMNPNDPQPLDLKIGNGPVWASGWIKFFKYYPTSITKSLTPDKTPREFIVNPQYLEQFKLHPNFDKTLKSKDDLDNKIDQYITEKNRFYAKLVKNQLLILTSREVNI
jgi:hypothetical protein